MLLSCFIYFDCDTKHLCSMDDHILNDLRLDLYKATVSVSNLQTKVGTLEMEIGELKATKSDSRAENIFWIHPSDSMN